MHHLSHEKPAERGAIFVTCHALVTSMPVPEENALPMTPTMTPRTTKMKSLIFTHLYQRPGAPQQATSALEQTLDMWLDHLRGPGCYSGDVILFTNVDGIKRDGLILCSYPNVPADPRRAHVHRALSYRLVP